MGTETTTRLLPSRIVGDAGTGGWVADCGIINSQALADYGRHAQLYWQPEGGGVWEPHNLLALDGSLLPRSITWDRGQSGTEVSISTSHVFLQNAGLQGIWFEESAAPANQHQMTGLSLGKIVKHIVEKHTNLTDWVDTSGIDIVNSSTTSVYSVRESTSIWNTIRAIGDNEFYVCYFTKADHLIYNCHPAFAATLPPVTMTIDSRYILGQPTVDFRDDVIPDQVQLGATTDKGLVLQANYPDHIGTEGRRHKIMNIRCNVQARLTQLAFRCYQHLSRRYTVKLAMPGAWGLLLELYDRVALTYTGTAANGVEFAWVAKKFWLTNISVSRVYDFGAVTELTLEEENFGEGYFYAG